jgi:hypothetical protein
MQITYFLASIIAYMGLFLGMLLIKLAPEEQKPGIKYFIFIKKVLFFLIMLFLLYFYRIHYLLSILLLIIISILMLTGKMKLNASAVIYFLFGVIFYLSYKQQDLFVIESVLIFLYGIPNASLMLKKNNYYDIFVKNVWFFAPVAILYFIGI